MLRSTFRHKEVAENVEFGYQTIKNFLIYVPFKLRPQESQ
jgi:hypothetical protein